MLSFYGHFGVLLVPLWDHLELRWDHCNINPVQLSGTQAKRMCSLNHRYGDSAINAPSCPNRPNRATRRRQAPCGQCKYQAANLAETMRGFRGVKNYTKICDVSWNSLKSFVFKRFSRSRVGLLKYSYFIMVFSEFSGEFHKIFTASIEFLNVFGEVISETQILLFYNGFQ